MSGYGEEYPSRGKAQEELDGRTLKISCPCGMVYVKPRPITPAEEAVIAAAVGWAHARGNSSPGNSGSHEGKSTEAWARELFEAVDAYVDPRPQAVRPEEVEPGTLFKFKDDPTDTIWRLVQIVGVEGSWYMRPGGVSVLHSFTPAAWIIPLPDQEEG